MASCPEREDADCCLHYRLTAQDQICCWCGDLFPVRRDEHLKHGLYAALSVYADAEELQRRNDEYRRKRGGK